MQNSPPSFCKSWFRAKKRPTEMWDEKRAKAAHDGGSPYTVLIGDCDRPTHFIEIASRSFNVGFLDEHLREDLTYSFQKVSDRELFLSMATHREFEGDADEVVAGASYVFKTTGEVDILHVTYRPAHAEESAKGRADVSSNYEPLPQFGSYDGLLDRERIKPEK